MTIQPLANHREHLPALAGYWVTEWAHLYRDWDENKARQEVETQNTDRRLPTTLVALEGTELLGSVSLIFDDLPGHDHLNPWLASLYVLPSCRGKSVGSALVKEAEQVFQQNGFHQAYLFTERTEKFFEMLGWQLMKKSHCHEHPVVILQKIWPRQSGSQG